MALLEQLKQRRVQLQEEERRLEELHVRMQQCLRNITQDSDEDRYPPQFYVSCGLILLGGSNWVYCNFKLLN